MSGCGRACMHIALMADDLAVQTRAIAAPDEDGTAEVDFFGDGEDDE